MGLTCLHIASPRIFRVASFSLQRRQGLTEAWSGSMLEAKQGLNVAGVLSANTVAVVWTSILAGC